jgi:hypothetical protein
MMNSCMQHCRWLLEQVEISVNPGIPKSVLF